MVERIDNSRRGERAGGSWRLVALTLLAVAGLPAAMGQTSNTAQFLAPSAGSKAGGFRAQYESGLANTGAYNVGSSKVNGSTVQQQVVGFTTMSNSEAFVPTVGLEYGKSYSVGPVSCAQTYDSTQIDPYLQTCSVTVTFAPLYPGGHRDAIYIFDSDGKTQLAAAFLYGIGLAPQLMIQPGVATSLQLSGAPYLYGLTTDDNGTLYLYANGNFYHMLKGGVPTLLASSVGAGHNGLSIDGAGNLFDTGNGGFAGEEYETYYGLGYAVSMCHTFPGNDNGNPVILPQTTCFSNPGAVAAGNAGIYYEADGGGEAESASGSVTASPGLLSTSYSPNLPVQSPLPTPVGDNEPLAGALPLPYPIDGGSYSPSTMVVDTYENLFFGTINGITVWCAGAYLSSSNAACGNSNALLMLNTTSPTGGMGVDAADTLYVSGYPAVQMFVAANTYSSSEASIGVSGGSNGNAVGPDGTVYADSTSTLNIIDRSQGSINWGSNNGQTNSLQTITIYNGGNQPLTLGTISLLGSSGYTLGTAVTNPCSNGLTVAAGAVCLIEVTSAPVVKGYLNGEIAITSNTLNEGNTLQEVALTGYTSGIYVTASPNPLSFGLVAPGGTSTLPVSLINTSAGSNAVGYGSSTVVSGGFTSSNSAFKAAVGTCNVSDPSGGPYCAINVTFSPGVLESYSGTITWTESIPGGPSQNMSLAVSGIGAPPVVPLADTEALTISDAVSLVPSTLLNVNEALTISDGVPATVASTLMNIGETLHLSDTGDVNGGSFSSATTTVLAASSSAVTAGNTVMLTATVTQADSSTPPASGAMNFYEDGAQFATANVSGGVATAVSPALVLGSHAFQAIYQGNGILTGSTSSVATVNAVSQTVLLVAAGSASRNFAAANPTFGFTIANTAGGAAPSVTGTPSLTTSATVNSLAGSYPIVATLGTLGAPAGYAFGFANGTLTVNGGAAQTITFARLPDLPVGVGKITLTAKSTSGLAVSYTVTGPASVAGSLLTITGTGTVTVTAAQNGNTTFAAATPAARSFTVTP